MNKLSISLSALVVVFAASTSQAETVNFDSGSAKPNNPPIIKAKKQQKKKVWVPAHRTNGRLVKGHYVWRTLGATSVTGFANHGLTCFAITS